MPEWVKRWFFEIIPPFIFMSKPDITGALLGQKQNNDDDESTVLQNNHQIHKLDNYLKTLSIDRYPPVIQRAIQDIQYISTMQREAEQDNLVCLKNKEYLFSSLF